MPKQAKTKTEILIEALLKKMTGKSAGDESCSAADLSPHIIILLSFCYQTSYYTFIYRQAHKII
jgi:hypothetical protein